MGLLYLYLLPSPNIIWVIKSRRWESHVARIGERISLYRALVGKPEGGGRFGRSRLRWEDNIKMDLHEWDEGVDWIDLAQERDRWRVFVNALINLRVP